MNKKSVLLRNPECWISRNSKPGIIVFAIAAISLLTSTPCGAAQAQLDSATLDYRNPFGFSWQNFNHPGFQIGSHRARCSELVNDLDGLVISYNKDLLIKECIRVKYTTTHIQSDHLPEFFRQGEISVQLRGESIPVEYNYRFLHRVAPGDNRENKVRRSNHAAVIRKELNKIYGGPVSTGHFDQGYPTGFVADDKKNGPCEAWLKQSVGIILCSERVILVDGIEMSLSFTRLDRAPYGRSLNCMIDPESVDHCEAASVISPADLSAQRDGFLEIMAEWVRPGHFRNCKADNLEPLEKVWTLPESDRTSLAPVLKAQSGDDLARFAIEKVNNDGQWLPTRKRDKIIMFLFRRAASQGSAIAMNEIGASLLYCYQGVQQDIGRARTWFEKAAAAGDPFAMKTLALMHVLGMIEAGSPAVEAVRLLEKCSRINADHCSNELTALREFLASQVESIQATDRSE